MLKFFGGFLLFLFIITSSTQAQTHEIGFGGGMANYRGDMSSIINITQPDFHGLFFYRYNRNEVWSFRVNAGLGQIRCSDSKSQDLIAKTRGHEFLTGVFEASGQIEYNFLNFGKSTPRKPQLFTPYALLGIGFFKFEPMRNSAPTYGSWGRCVPLGLGVKWLLTNHLQLNAEVAARFTSTDYLDDLGINTNANAPANVQNTKLYTGNPNTKDMYFFSHISLSYVFRNKHDICPIKPQ